MLQKVAFTLYPVLDIHRAKTFYENNFGLSPNKISANGSWVEYDLPGGGCFAITTLAEGVKPSSNSGGSIAFEVEDLDKLVEQLKSNYYTANNCHSCKTCTLQFSLYLFSRSMGPFTRYSDLTVTALQPQFPMLLPLLLRSG